MKDVFGRELQVGDEVAFYDENQKVMKKAIVFELSPHFTCVTWFSLDERRFSNVVPSWNVVKSCTSLM